MSFDPSSKEERMQEGREIQELLMYSGVVPERWYLPYYLVSMNWY